MKLNTMQLSKQYPDMWQKLPECYREDDVLVFFMRDGYLHFEVKPEEQDIVGCPTGYWDEYIQDWFIS